MKPVVSIIIPAYQVEKYIYRCLDSILNQTLDSFEVILVNDGSSDNTGIIAEDYKNLDSRIQVYHQNNQGASSARNTGLTYAKGDYVIFIDSDDFIEKEMLEILVTLADSGNYDVIVPYINYYLNDSSIKRKIVTQFDCCRLKSCNPIEYVIEVVIGQGRNWSVSRGALYLNDIIKNNTLRFPYGYIAEDMVFNLKYFCYVKSMTVCKEPLYNYCIREESVTHSHRPELLKSYFLIDKEVFDFIKHSGYNNHFGLLARDSLLCRNIIIYFFKNIIYSARGGFKYQTQEVGKLFDHNRVMEAFSRKEFLIPYWPSKKAIIYVIIMRYLLRHRFIIPAVLLARLARALEKITRLLEG